MRVNEKNIGQWYIFLKFGKKIIMIQTLYASEWHNSFEEIYACVFVF